MLFISRCIAYMLTYTTTMGVEKYEDLVSHSSISNLTCLCWTEEIYIVKSFPGFINFLGSRAILICLIVSIPAFPN